MTAYEAMLQRLSAMLMLVIFQMLTKLVLIFTTYQDNALMMCKAESSIFVQTLLTKKRHIPYYLKKIGQIQCLYKHA